tara:strand:+ start:448 stop:657 length:210 start_codon:yes stop_codon:yes gene_type:complete
MEIAPAHLRPALPVLANHLSTCQAALSHFPVPRYVFLFLPPNLSTPTGARSGDPVSADAACCLMLLASP